jgi:hypothetical protein
MPLVDPPLAFIDERQLGLVRTALVDSDPKFDGVLASTLAAAASRAAASGDIEGERALHLATRLVSIPIDGLDPTPPVSVATLRVAATPDPQEVEVTKKLLDGITTPAVKARLADLLWRWTKEHRFAELAIETYFEAGAPFETPEEWPSCTRRYQRAVQLAASLGKGRPTFTSAIQRIEAALLKTKDDTSFLTRELIQILLDHKQGDPKMYASMAEAAARRLESTGKFLQAREYWGAVTDCYSAIGDQDARQAATASGAETFVKEAEAELANEKPSHLRAAAFIRDAIGILDKLQPGGRPRVAELRTLLAECGKKAMGEMKPLRLPIDLSDAAREARMRVTGKSQEDALVALATVTRVPSRSRLEADVRDAVKNFPLQHIFPVRMVSPDGGVVGGRAGIDLDEPEESPLLTEMVQHALIHYGVSCQGTIEPARRILMAEHGYHERDLARLVEASPFVPPGREPFFSRGLFAGLEGDYFLSTHVLVPQIEHAMRCLLKSRGVNTIKVNRDGLDEERDFGDLIRLPETTQLIGEDVSFSLRALLLHRSGPHFRDLLAHGLLEYGAFFSVHAGYLWWLTLYICVVSILATQPTASGEMGESPENEAGQRVKK